LRACSSKAPSKPGLARLDRRLVTAVCPMSGGPLRRVRPWRGVYASPSWVYGDSAIAGPGCSRDALPNQKSSGPPLH